MKCSKKELYALIYAYNSVWDEYKKIARARKDISEIKKIKLKWIKEKLKTLEGVLEKCKPGKLDFKGFIYG